jgi:hypothetical protein
LDERPARVILTRVILTRVILTRVILTRISAVSSVGHPLTVQGAHRRPWYVTSNCELDIKKKGSRDMVDLGKCHHLSRPRSLALCLDRRESF